MQASSLYMWTPGQGIVHVQTLGHRDGLVQTHALLGVITKWSKIQKEVWFGWSMMAWIVGRAWMNQGLHTTHGRVQPVVRGYS